MSLELKSNDHQNNLKPVKSSDPNVYEFDDFILDASHLMLCRRGGEEISMTPKQVETLLALVERNGEIVAIDTLMDRLWPNAFVEEANLVQNIHILRKTLGSTESGKPMIETLRRRGYRFNGEVKTIERNQIAPTASSKEAATLVKFPTVITNRVPTDTVSGPSVLSKYKLFAAVALLLLITVTLSIGYYFYSSRSAANGNKKSIAVLPLKPINSAHRDEIYENGIADAIIQRLASIKGFVVRPLSATRKYANIEQDAMAAGKEQQVDYVLSSNYQLADGKIKFTAQLFNVANGQIEDTYKSEKEAANLFVMQDAIAGDIGNLLQKRFVTTSTNLTTLRGTTSEEAYRLYLQGKALSENGKKAEGGKAIEYLERAIEIDPAFARAYAEMGSVYIRDLNVGGRRATEGYIKAKAAIEKAMEIDESVPESHTYLGIIKTNYEWDFAGAEREHKRALDLDPNSSSAHCMYSLMLGTLGRFEESIVEMKTAIELEPASASIRHSYGWLLFQAHRFDEAIAEEELVIKMDPNLAMAYNVLSNSYGYKGDNDRSFASYLHLKSLRGDDPEEIDSLKTLYARSGWRGVSEREFDDLKSDEKNGKPDYAKLAGTSIELGMNEEAIAYLEKAMDQNRFTVITLKVNPRYDPLRPYPQFDDLVRRIGLK